MRKFALLLVVALVLAVVMPSSALACVPGKITFGGWQHRLIGPVGVSTSTWSYSGNAIGDGTGAAKGSIQMQRDTNVDYKLHCDVRTIILEPDFTAWVGAVVLTSTDPAIAPGTEFVVKLQDLGEGKNAPADRTSEIWIGETWHAWDMMDLFLYGWSGGNVQIHLGK